MRRALLFTLLAILLVLTSSIRAQVNSTEVLTNDTIISLTQANLGDSLIISKIKTSSCTFDLSTDNLLNLKNAGVSNAVIETMIKVSTPTANVVVVKTANDINDPQSPHDAGIYVYDGKTMVQLEPTTYSGEKTAGFFTSALTYGMAPIQTKASIRNPHASVRAPASAEFYFYFEQSSSGLSNVTGIAAYFSGATSPNEFALLRMESKRTERDVTLHSIRAFGISSGTASKDTANFTTTKIAPGVYKVSVNSLKPGEYCFYFGTPTNQHKLFDFGVDDNKSKKHR